MVSFSIVMTTYNGEEYIGEQINSILCQLKPCDELIISDDGSTDNTNSIVDEYIIGRPNVRHIYGPRKGVIENFSSAFLIANKEYIVICDQDDIWCNDKLDTIRTIISTNRKNKVFMHDAYKLPNGKEDIYENKNMLTIFKDRKAKHGVIRNIIYSTYYGCCMIVDREYLISLLPVPKGNLYDQYVGNCAELDNTSMFIPNKLIYHREHSGNWSQKQSPYSQLRYRIAHMKGVLRHFENNQSHF